MNRKNIIQFILGILYSVSFIYMLLPIAYWYLNPSLSQMEVFLDTWLVIFFGILIFSWANFWDYKLINKDIK